MTKKSDMYPKVYMGDAIIDFDAATLHITSAAVLYGLSVYTVFPVSISVNKLVAFRLAEHFKRLKDSAQIMGIDGGMNDWDYNEFLYSVRRLIQSNNINNDVFVRVTIHVSDLIPGTRSRGLDTTISMFVYNAHSIFPKSGARLKTTHWRRVPDTSIPARAKVNGAYVNSSLGKQDAIDSGYDDCIFLDNNGHVCELSAANIFLVRDGVLITPSSTSDILEGINRKSVIEYADDLGIEVQERTVDLTELYIADEVFACGTSAYLSPIIEIDSRRIGDGKQGEITKKLSKVHNDVLHGKNKKYMAALTSF